MKKMAFITVFFCLIASGSVNACDEQCLREKAESEKNTSFPAYLTWSYCQDIRMDFITSSMKSLEKYKENNLNPKYKGGMRNTKNYIDQRKEWLQECDSYFVSTHKGRIFYDEKTTSDIFAAMDSVSNELSNLIDGVQYSSHSDSNVSQVTLEKFDNLFKVVDDHKTLMHLKGRYVFR